jgi:hypothetical protein
MRRGALTLILIGLLCQPAAADLARCLDATCRINGPGGVVGTGCAFDETADSYLILTNAHVVGQLEGTSIACEFWKNGYSLGQVEGKVVQAWRLGSMRDIAVASISKSKLTVRPAIVPLGPRGAELSSRTVVSVGCALGGWPTAWKGHVLEAGSATVWFLPTPADGRSGSALFDEAGRMIVGLVGWRAADGDYGIAMHLGEIYAAFDGKPPVQTTAVTEAAPMAPVQYTSASSCIHGLPLSQLCAECQGSCDRRLPFGLFGNRRTPQEEEKVKPFGDGAYSPWSGSSEGESGGAVGPAPPDLSSYATRSELTAVESRLNQSMQQVNQRLGSLETQTQAALDQSQRASVQIEAQKKTSESNHTSLLQRLAEFASREELVAKYQEAREAGAEAGREAARKTALAVVAEKLGETGGMALWHTLLSALGISGPIGIGLAALGWFVSRRAGRRIVQRSRGAEEAPPQAPFRGQSA